jgi:diamine N-acetyltransferase
VHQPSRRDGLRSARGLNGPNHTGYAPAVVSLQPITQSNRDALDGLRVSPAQRRFVSGVSESLRQAAEHPGARAIPWGVYAEDTPVGFVMIADEVDGPPYIAQYLWKLLIDERHQRKGYGTATLDLIVQYFRGRPGVEVIWTSAGQGDGSPIPFYERYGFEQTGDIQDGEVKLRLTIS